MVSPVMNWVRSMMWAPMSPSAPGAGLVLLQAPRQRRLRVDDPVLEVLGAHVVERAEASLGDELPGEGDRRHAPVGEADHGAYAVGGRALGGAGHRLGLLDACWPAASRTGRACRPRGRRWRSRRGCGRGCRCRRGRCRRARPGPARRSRWTPSRGARLRRGRPRRHDRRRRPCGDERQVEEAGGGAPGVGVRGAHEGVAHHADATVRGRRCWSSCVLRSVPAGRRWPGSPRGPGASRPGDRIRTRTRSMNSSTLSGRDDRARRAGRCGAPRPRRGRSSPCPAPAGGPA